MSMLREIYEEKRFQRMFVVKRTTKTFRRKKGRKMTWFLRGKKDVKLACNLRENVLRLFNDHFSSAPTF